MSYFFTSHFKSALTADQTIMNVQQVKLVLFRYAPAMGVINPAWTAAKTVAELVATSPGWVEVSGVDGYPSPFQVSYVTDTRLWPDSAPVGTGSLYVTFNNTYPFSGLEQRTEVQAIGVVRVASIGGVAEPLLFVTNSPIASTPNIAPGDGLTANPDSTFPDTYRWMFSWSRASPDPIEGPLALALGPPEFEVSGSQHCWLYPQRANMIANPNFEAPGMGYWSSNGTLTRVSGTAPGSDSTHGWAGSVSGTAPVVMESNVFPTRLGDSNSEQWTVQLKAKGYGKLKVGLVFWDADHRVTAADWGVDESWDLSPTGWMHVATHRTIPEAALAMVRLETDGTALTIDNVLAERGYLKDWAYFDGEERYGARDDFSWYGGTNRRGASYSLWYNHRKAVTSRLFARTVDPNDPSANVTDEDMEEQGLVYRWVPAGITVVPHLDVFYPFDAQNPIPTKPAGVLAYRSGNAPDGVSNPWL